MSFSTVQFVFVFLPVAWLVFFVLPRRARNLVLAGFSLLFCLWGSYGGTALLLVFVLFNWLAGLALARADRAGNRCWPPVWPLIWRCWGCSSTRALSPRTWTPCCPVWCRW